MTGNLALTATARIGVVEISERKVALVVHEPHPGLLKVAITVLEEEIGSVEGRSVRNAASEAFPVEAAVSELVLPPPVLGNLEDSPVIIDPVLGDRRLGDDVRLLDLLLPLRKVDTIVIIGVELSPVEVEVLVHLLGVRGSLNDASKHLVLS